MPAQLQFFDMEASLPAAQTVNQPVPVTLGSNWQPGDIRVFFQLWYQPVWNSTTGRFYLAVTQFQGQDPHFSFYNYDETTPYTGPNGLSIPAGYSSVSNNAGVGGALGCAVAYRRLVAGDTNTFVTYAFPAAMTVFATIFFTVRGVDPAWTGTGNGGVLTWDATTVTKVNSQPVPGAGTLVYFATSYPKPAAVSSNAPPWASATYTGLSLGEPTGWTNLVATSGSGNSFYVYVSNSSALAVAKAYTGPTSTGAVTFEAGAGSNPAVDGMYMWFKPAPDVAGIAGSASTAATSAASVYSSSTLVSSSAGSALTTTSTSTAFNPSMGYWISDPLVLSGSPVTGSTIRWSAVIPPLTSLLVETSINNGASWEKATSNQPIPRLKERDTFTQSVLVRVTFSLDPPPSLYPGTAVFPSTHLFPAGSPPRLTSLEAIVSTDTSVDELVPIGMGMIDQVTVHATSGTTGAGSSTNVAGSTGVIGRGGGQTGGGTAIKIHAVDLSGAIKRNVWQMPYTVPSGLLYTEAIKIMVLDRLPDQKAFNLASTTRVTPPLLYGAQQGGDPWQDLQELAQAIGFEAFFDAAGTFVCRPVPDPRTGDPVWQFDEAANPTVAEAERQFSSDQTFNDIVVVGQSTSTQNPFTAEAYDDDPSSPTYVLGPYGRVTQRLTFSLITSQDQAQDTADAALFNSLGAADTVTLTVVPMPALEPGDIVKVVCSNIRANGTYMINSMTTPLSPADPMQLTCFKQSRS